ncbi:MAG: type III secretion system translocon subunit SctE [Desulfovibrionaceae bacterium]|nr:type III secretion system translocon subunit SctE [Desulfovibrionaceae bacterium]
MSQVNNNYKSSFENQLANIDQTTLIELTAKLKQAGLLPEGLQVPPSSNKTPNETGVDLPILTKPALAAGGSLSLEVLMQALGDEVRQSETKAGMATVKANAEQRESVNKEKLAKIDEQIEKLENAGIWGKIAKAFSWIGAIAAVVVSAALVATGVGGPLGVAGLVLASTALANQVLDTVGESVSGEGWGLTSLAGKLSDKIFGEGVGQWVKFGLDIAFTVATIACSCGAGSGAAAAKAASSSGKVLNMVSKCGSAAQGVAGVAQGGAQIASAVYTKDASDATAAQKRFEAILEQIKMINDLTLTHMKQVIEDNQKTTETVSEIVKEHAETQTSILTGGACAMA